MRTSIRTAGILAGLLATACAGSRTTPGPPPADLSGKIALVSYTSCDDMLAGLRDATEKNVTAWGLGGDLMLARTDVAASAKQQATPDQAAYSTTNVNEEGVDEPD